MGTMYFSSCWLIGVILLALCEQIQISQAKLEQECATRGRREPLVISHGKEVLLESPDSPFEKRVWGKDDSGNAEILYVLDESKSLFYVPNFLNSSIASELQSFCEGRFVGSPVRDSNVEADGGITKKKSVRTSESCALVPVAAYLSNPRFQEMREQTNPDQQTTFVIRMVDVAFSVSQRAASLLSWDPLAVEPLQLVRYRTPDAYYNIHHDHGNFYGNEREQRPWTILTFLNDVSKGGHTHFPKLGLRVAPRGGDAIVWRNVVTLDPSSPSSSEADPDMIHAGEPPGEDGIEKYALNIWLEESARLDKPALLASGKWGAAQTS